MLRRIVSLSFIFLIALSLSCGKDGETSENSSKLKLKDSKLKLKDSNKSSDYELTRGSEKTLSGYFDIPSGVTMTYKLKEEFTGVSISGEKLIVGADAKSGEKFTVIASHEKTSDVAAASVEVEFTVVETANKANSTLRVKLTLEEKDFYLNRDSEKELSGFFDIPSGVTMTYKLKAATTGVTISGSKLSVSNQAVEGQDGKFTITASHAETGDFKAGSVEMSFTVRRAFNITAASSIPNITIPASDDEKKSLYDFFTNVVEAQLGISFALKSSYTGVSIDQSTKELVVSSTAQAGDVTVVITEEESSITQRAVEGGTAEAVIKLVTSGGGGGGVTPPSSGTLASGQIKIKQSWDQGGKTMTDYERLAEVFVPSGGAKNQKYPILINMHGSGGNAESVLIPYKKTSPAPDVTGYIVVAPQGYGEEKNGKISGTWNLGKQDSEAPDISFIKLLIEKLKTYDNVNGDNITVLGRSNGGAMAMQLAIELPETYFKNVISIVTNLNTWQYHDDKFWGINESSTEDNPFTVEKTPAPRQKIMIINGEKDIAIPYAGGNGIARTIFLSTEESIFLLAKAMGYTGSKTATTDVTNSEFSGKNTGDVKKVSYLNDKVVMYNFVEGDHAFGSKTYTDLNSESNRLINDFLNSNK